ncbi:MAG: HXXEE domain-containing protein [Planctomycetota bacterium]
MPDTPYQRLLHQWAPAMLPVGLLLLATAGVLATVLPTWWVLVWLQLPLYVLHQYEEHDGGRFGRWVNARLGRHGREVLTPTDILVINLPLVWGVITLSAALALWVRPGLGLIAPYLTLSNAIVHIGPALAMRAYNPGLITAVALFLPGGAAAVAAVQQTGDATLAMHALAGATTVVLHGLIVVKVLATRHAMLAPSAR